MSIDLQDNFCHSKIVFVRYLVVVSEKNVVDKLFVNKINTVYDTNKTILATLKMA